MKNFYIILGFVFAFILTANAQQWNGYTLVSVKGATSAQLLDTNGTVYHTWTDATGKKTGYSSYVTPGGYLWRSIQKSGNSFTGGPICGEVQKMDYNSNVIWDFVYSTTAYCTHHDIYPMPNGNVLLIAYEAKTSTEVAAAGCSTFSGTMWPDKIVEVQPTGPTTGTVVWEWHVWDHLVQNTNSSAANYQSSIVDHPELLNINYLPQKDWMHVNGVHYNPVLDQITISSHNLNELYVIDHSTTTAEAAGHTGGNSGKGGDFLYRWGNPAAYQATGTKIFKVVHDAHWILEGHPNEGYLVGYNNQGISTNASCVDMINPPVSGYNYSLTPGSAYLPSTYDKRQASGGYNSNEGGSQMLPNGNLLVCMGISGYIKEFSPTGTLLWTYTTSGPVAKAFRYDACYLNNQPPAIPAISENGGILTSSAATTYQWYLNGVQIPGATSQNYTPTQSGIYLVRITDANGCVYEYSDGYDYTLSTFVSSSEILAGISIFPNPTSGELHLDVSGINGNEFMVLVHDLAGRTVLKEKNQSILQLSGLENGTYLITLQSGNATTLPKKINILK